MVSYSTVTGADAGSNPAVPAKFMKKIPCANATCGERRIHHERPDEPRGTQMVQVADDYEGRVYCSIECYCYFKADHPELEIEHLVSIPKDCQCAWCKVNPPLKRCEDKLKRFNEMLIETQNESLKPFIMNVIEKLLAEKAELESVPG